MRAQAGGWAAARRRAAAGVDALGLRPGQRRAAAAGGGSGLLDAAAHGRMDGRMGEGGAAIRCRDSVAAAGGARVRAKGCRERRWRARVRARPVPEWSGHGLLLRLLLDVAQRPATKRAMGESRAGAGCVLRRAAGKRGNGRERGAAAVGGRGAEHASPHAERARAGRRRRSRSRAAAGDEAPRAPRAAASQKHAAAHRAYGVAPGTRRQRRDQRPAPDEDGAGAAWQAPLLSPLRVRGLSFVEEASVISCTLRSGTTLHPACGSARNEPG
jgi:hypothetical protein